MLALLTSHGTIVCRRDADGALTHQPLDRIPVGEQVASFTRDGDTLAENAGSTRLHILAEDRRWIAVAAADWPLTAPTRVPTLAAYGPEIRRHEHFTAIPLEALPLIRMLAAHAWIVRSTREILRVGTIRLVPGPALQIGRRRLDLAMALPYLAGGKLEAPTSVTLFFEGWKVDELVAYRPLVFFVAFGADWVFERLAVALNALAQLGEYCGDVLVIGDRSAEAIAALAPSLAPERVHVHPTEASGFVEFCAARYRVGNWMPARGHAPLLYMDIDVVVDRPLELFLVEVALARQISAQREDIAPLARSRPVGARLFIKDGIDVGEACGFNSGILAIPSLADHGSTLLQIGEGIRLYERHFGPRALSHFDQAIANYVTFKLARVADEPVTSRVRFTMQRTLQGGCEPSGFVHFWGSGPRTTRVMARYVRGLLDARTGGDEPPPPDVDAPGLAAAELAD